MTHGGKRAGAGRPKGARTKRKVKREIFADAESYLAAVVEGRAEPDPARITAAKVLIAYQRKKERAPLPAPRRTELKRKEVLAAEDAVAKEFERRAAAIRSKHKRKTT